MRNNQDRGDGCHQDHLCLLQVWEESSSSITIIIISFHPDLHCFDLALSQRGPAVRNGVRLPTRPNLLKSRELCLTSTSTTDPKSTCYAPTYPTPIKPISTSSNNNHFFPTHLSFPWPAKTKYFIRLLNHQSIFPHCFPFARINHHLKLKII